MLKSKVTTGAATAESLRNYSLGSKVKRCFVLVYFDIRNASKAIQFRPISARYRYTVSEITNRVNKMEIPAGKKPCLLLEDSLVHKYRSRKSLEKISLKKFLKKMAKIFKNLLFFVVKICCFLVFA